MEGVCVFKAVPEFEAELENVGVCAAVPALNGVLVGVSV